MHRKIPDPMVMPYPHQRDATQAEFGAFLGHPNGSDTAATDADAENRQKLSDEYDMDIGLAGALV